MPTTPEEDQLLRAAAALAAGDPQQVVRICERALKRLPGHPDALHLKGLALHLMGERGRAVAAIQQAIRRAPDRAAYHGNLGRVWAAEEEYVKAAACFAEALRLAPDSARDHEDLGVALCCLERLDEGARSFERALELDRRNAGAMLKLARAWAHLGRHAPALGLVERALAADPRLEARALAITGFVRLEQRRWGEAVEAYGRALAREPDQVEALLGRAKAWLRQGEPDRARADGERALAAAPESLEARLLMGQVERDFGDTARAATAFERAIALRPGDFRARWERANLLPPAYESTDHIAAEREAWEGRMRQLADDLRLDSPERINSAAGALKAANDFRLPYQGLDDRPLQQLYGGIVQRIAAARYPHLAHPPVRAPGTRPRVGFISEFLRRHSIWKTHSAWIAASGREFEKFVYYTGVEFDEGFTSVVRDAADHFVQETSVEPLIPRIAEDRLDVLVYLDHGMSVGLQIAAALWLAPVQVNGLGHPVTSGLPTMTHALSSALMEPAEGELHYTESLVRLPNTASCYSLARLEEDLASVPPPVRGEDRVEFLCAQNLKKHLPQHDGLFAHIAAELPAARFHFIARAGEGHDVFARRLAAAFAAEGLESERFCRFHPGLGTTDYIGLNLSCDAFLDTPSWSGNNTAHEAVACGLPIVTWPGSLMRARHGLAILTMLGMTETIAGSADDYVRLAVRLGRDKEWLGHLRQETLVRRRRLFDDPAPIRALEVFLASVTGNRGPLMRTG